MGSSSTKSNADPNIEASERFKFRFTDCSCKCEATKRRADDLLGQNDLPQAALLTALMAQVGRSQYDICKHRPSSGSSSLNNSLLSRL